MRQNILILLFLVSGIVAAEQSTSDRKGPPPDGGDDKGGMAAGNRPHRRPPPEALEACNGKASGTACSFHDREGVAKSGSCWAPDTTKPLACRPSDMNKGQQ